MTKNIEPFKKNGFDISPLKLSTASGPDKLPMPGSIARIQNELNIIKPFICGVNPYPLQPIIPLPVKSAL